MIWTWSLSSDVRRQTFQRHGIAFVEEEVWCSGAGSKTSGPYVAWGKAVSSAVGQVLSWEHLKSATVAPFRLMKLMHCRGEQSVQFGTSALHRCPLLMVWSFWIFFRLTISVHWNSLQLKFKPEEWQSIPSKPSTYYFIGKWYVVYCLVMS